MALTPTGQARELRAGWLAPVARHARRRSRRCSSLAVAMLVTALAERSSLRLRASTGRRRDENTLEPGLRSRARAPPRRGDGRRVLPCGRAAVPNRRSIEVQDRVRKPARTSLRIPVARDASRSVHHDLSDRTKLSRALADAPAGAGHPREVEPGGLVAVSVGERRQRPALARRHRRPRSGRSRRRPGSGAARAVVAGYRGEESLTSARCSRCREDRRRPVRVPARARRARPRGRFRSISP